jgi:hypothetical protein
VRCAAAGVALPVAAADGLLETKGAARERALPSLISGSALAIAEVAEVAGATRQTGAAAAHGACPTRAAPGSRLPGRPAPTSGSTARVRVTARATRSVVAIRADPLVPVLSAGSGPQNPADDLHGPWAHDGSEVIRGQPAACQACWIAFGVDASATGTQPQPPIAALTICWHWPVPPTAQL